MATINNINLATLSFDEIRKLLSPEEIARVYRLQQLDYRIQDVKAHAEDMLNKGDITEEEKNFVIEHGVEIAELFLYKYSDCTLAENDVFECLIDNYLTDNYR